MADFFCLKKKKGFRCKEDSEQKMDVVKQLLYTYFLPVLSTERLPYCFLAVANQAIRELARPKMGESVAASIFCLPHIKVRVAGRTAEDMMTPIIKYKYPMEIPISSIFQPS